MSPQICCNDEGQTDGDDVGDGKMVNECDVGVVGVTPLRFEVDLATVATSRGMIQLWTLFKLVSLDLEFFGRRLCRHLKRTSFYRRGNSWVKVAAPKTSSLSNLASPSLRLELGGPGSAIRWASPENNRKELSD